ncbi:HEAT repeat domain-containing protein [Streptomyces sp. NPDC002838]|uniref:HEAT repeat domain-containing protein n=1 Tax=Streptomyces sp. NPDC002838 TaxID=3154436 RepID=UPI0033249314
MSDTRPGQGGPHRILALLELADEAPTTEELAEFLTDTDPDVRRTALTVLSEAAESWEEPSAVFAAALLDPAATVRRVAIELLSELREVLVSGERFSRSLREACGHPDTDVRAAAVVALWRHRLCRVDELTSLLNDPDEVVRCGTVLGLVSLDALDALAKAAGDPAASVRLAVARGLAAVGDPRGAATLIRLAEDSDVLVRAAALSAMAHTGCTEQAADLARTALADPAWQIRQGAAAALAVADPQQAVAPLIAATRDTNLDVRKAAVRALGGLAAGRPDVQAALEAAVADVDADVRAFARMGLTDAQSDLTESPTTDTATG